MKNISKKFTFPLFETIRLENGTVSNLQYHQKRLCYAYGEMFGTGCPFDLEKILMKTYKPEGGVHKIRFLYNQNNFIVEILPYKTRKISNLRMVFTQGLDYHLKFTDRTPIENLLRQKGFCDDILIVDNGLVKEISFANVAFYDGKDWFTPSGPLLQGTALQRYLDEKKLIPVEIRPYELGKYRCIKFFNAMLEIDSQPCISTDQIYF